MHVIARPKLREFYERDEGKDAKGPIDTWWYEAKKAKWQSWTDIKSQYGSVSILKGNRVVFNLGGNKYRLVVKINFPTQTVFIRFVGTHKEYDKINAEEI
ncbi:type II toxin-antitoxin system HigB family toxin [uncultured Desulfobacter sp.]|uniref:type II toxin-antitoxin system HigB family toxin n=1 Tax=uncultured Desulfobacter sp. TaxID=240139 RepID=UPI0029F59E2F|nr:type II toxin-antitoxin system HigB family toxin [uncultured Desulfobacter sp.]